jgi:hypothetical protein
VEFFKNSITLLIKSRLNKKHPHFFDSKYSLSDSIIVFEYKIEYFPKRLNLLVYRCDNLIIFPNFLPELIPQLCLDLVVSVIIKVSGTVHKQLIGEPMLIVSLGKHSVNQEVIVKGISSICRFLRDDSLQSHFFNNLIFNSSHEFLDAILEHSEYVV